MCSHPSWLFVWTFSLAHYSLDAALQQARTVHALSQRVLGLDWVAPVWSLKTAIPDMRSETLGASPAGLAARVNCKVCCKGQDQRFWSVCHCSASVDRPVVIGRRVNSRLKRKTGSHCLLRVIA